MLTGRRTTGDRGILLDVILPEYQFGEVHETLVCARPSETLRAAKEAAPDEMPLVRLLFGVRSLPAIFSRRGGLPSEGRLPLWDQMLDFGFVFLGEDPSREIAAGAIGQMWKPGGGTSPSVHGAREFAAFGEPGYARVAMNFSVEAEGDLTRLRTETRVHCTDAGAQRNFGLYWRMIQPGSAVIRRSWLHAAKRRAESAAGGAA